MKAVVLLIFVAVSVVFATCSSSTAKPKAFANAEVAKCQALCSDTSLKPICAQEGKKVINFGNECTMKKYNCQHKTNMVKKQDSECAEAGHALLNL